MAGRVTGLGVLRSGHHSGEDEEWDEPGVDDGREEHVAGGRGGRSVFRGAHEVVDRVDGVQDRKARL